jgi:tripartite-type tricarboxylate transporter receptor subunit TctC
MKPPRRQFLHLAAGAAALPAVSRIARAQAYPTRPVRIIAPTGPAGAPDILARLIAPWLSERLGQQFVSKTAQGAATISAPKRWCGRRRTAIRSSSSARRTRSTRPSTTSSISCSCAASRHPTLLAYATTKGAIQNFTAGLAQLVAEKGIRANTVA